MKRWLLLAPASAAIGFGHVARALVLLDAVRARGDVVKIVVTPDVAAIADTSACIERIPIDAWTAQALGPIVKASDAVLLDAPDELLDDLAWTRQLTSFVAAFRMHGLQGATNVFEDVSLTPSFALPALHETQRLGRRHRHLSGRDLLMVRASCFATEADEDARPPHVLVTMGGSDPLGLTALACEVLLLVDRRFRTSVVVGRLSPAFAALKERFGDAFEVVRQGELVFDETLRRSTLALINAGLTRYECIAARTPFVAFSMHHQQAAFTQQVVQAGFGWHAGVAPSIEPARVAGTITEALDRPEILTAMRSRAVGLIEPGWPRALVDRLATWLPAAT